MSRQLGRTPIKLPCLVNLSHTKKGREDGRFQNSLMYAVPILALIGILAFFVGASFVSAAGVCLSLTGGLMLGMLNDSVSFEQNDTIDRIERIVEQQVDLAIAGRGSEVNLNKALTVCSEDGYLNSCDPNAMNEFELEWLNRLWEKMLTAKTEPVYTLSTEKAMFDITDSKFSRSRIRYVEALEEVKKDPFDDLFENNDELTMNVKER